MVVIQNGVASAGISELGAELKSFQKGGREVIWHSDPLVWTGSAPILFPICGGLKNDRYRLNGQEYTLEKHGFARKKEFTVEEHSANRAVFLLRDDEETRQKYPFSFELRVIYELQGDSLHITYRVENRSAETMYFSIGSHEAYATPEGVEDYDVIFPQKETLKAYQLDGNLLEEHTLPILYESEVLPLYDKYFIVDALVFLDLKSRSARLRNRKTGAAVRVDFPDCEYFLLWHKHGTGFMCLEPWCGIQDSVDADGELKTKPGIRSLAAGGTYQTAHTITILNGKE